MIPLVCNLPKPFSLHRKCRVQFQAREEMAAHRIDVHGSTPAEVAWMIVPKMRADKVRCFETALAHQISATNALGCVDGAQLCGDACAFAGGELIDPRAALKMLAVTHGSRGERWLANRYIAARRDAARRVEALEKKGCN